jgi:DmsE family decaheme c-type cytochrome
MNQRRPFLITSALLTFIAWAYPQGSLVPDLLAQGMSDPASVRTCTNCHDEPSITAVLHTAHGVLGDVRTGIQDDGCQSCHGNSDDHVARVVEGQQRPPPEWVFDGPNASPAEVLNRVCAGCHEGGTAMHWQGSLHASSDIACTDCHASHPVQDAVLSKASQATICFTCHAVQRAASLRPSHHPIVEGQMACSDCHNPHGSIGPNMLREASVNDTCHQCHDEKRGPFLWEHAPVQEQCTICHTPHGSIQASLLRQRPPYLCQNCHDSSLHTSQPFSGSNLPGGSFPSRQLVLRGCLNCHSQVHGSNHPSGARFTR